MAFRLVLGLPIILIVITINRVRIRLSGNSRAIALASIIIGLHFIIQITGIKYTTATNTGWIISLTPLVTAALAGIILKEKIGLRTVIGIIIATSGILLLISHGKIGDFKWLSSIGDWLVLGSAHTWALYTIVTRDVSRSQNPLSVTFWVLLPSTVIASAIVVSSSDLRGFAALPAEAVISLLFLGIVATALAHWFWQFGLAKVGAAQAGIFLYLEPLATTSLAVPYLHESFGVFTALGGVMVLGGVWIAQMNKKLTRDRNSASPEA